MFKNHIELTGTLTVLSPLHLGSGVQAPPGDTEDGREGTPVQPSSVQRDGDKNPYIPSTSIKGALRAWLTDKGQQQRVFGAVDHKTVDHKAGVMGRLWIYGAVHRKAGRVEGLEHHGKDRPDKIYVVARTRIDRASGTAADHMLFRTEMVPVRTTFGFRAKWLTNAGLETVTDDLNDVATALAPLLADTGLALGRGGRQGLGRVRLALESAQWVPWDGEPSLLDLPTVAVSQPGEPIRLTLSCKGPYLSVDSSQKQEQKDGAPDNVLSPLKDAEGKPVLSGSSLLGVLRARAAWLDGGKDDPGRVYPSFDPLTPTERLFGVTGWRGLLEVESITAAACEIQRFPSVKIDRFSAAPIEGALFFVDAFINPRFDVVLRFRPRWEEAEAVKSLLDTLLTDIKDMGLMLGHGGGRGFGWFTVKDAEEPNA